MADDWITPRAPPIVVASPSMQLPAIRRVFAIAALVGVLLGLGQPLVACAMDMPSGPCCPAGMDPGCDGDTGLPATAACPDVTGCAATSLQTALVASMPDERRVSIHQTTSGSDPPDAAAALSQPCRATVAAVRAATHQHFVAATATRTYLLTARLRL